MASETTKKITDASRFYSIFLSIQIWSYFHEKDDCLNESTIIMFLMRIIIDFISSYFM